MGYGEGNRRPSSHAGYRWPIFPNVAQCVKQLKMQPYQTKNVAATRLSIFPLSCYNAMACSTLWHIDFLSIAKCGLKHKGQSAQYNYIVHTAK